MRLVRFMESGTGRVARGVAGAALVGLGAWLGATYGGAWWALFAVGFLPLTAGVANFCLAAPLFGAPLRQVHQSA